MSLSPEQQRSIADLVAQVNVDNVLQATALFQKQVDDMERALLKADQDLRLEPLGGDSVSRDAVRMFQPKIQTILDVHWAHCAELRGAIEALRRCAFDYGYTEADLAESLRKLVAR